ncbi:MAG: hypothetical protein M1816_006628 [Peltula sp. TS41687]|nr:MAG: hypothetical protein M1816_006628 [Peltula sp. TS41687]
MDALRHERHLLSRRSNLTKATTDLQNTIDLLTKARDSIVEEPSSASLTLAKLQGSTKQSLDKLKNTLKEIHEGYGKYQKALDRHVKAVPLPNSTYHELESHRSLVSRAIAIHLLREGQFSVASTFLEEAASELAEAQSNVNLLSLESFRAQFTEMYHILHELRNNRNLMPAIEWAKWNREKLEARGSNLEFDLGKLQFIWLFMSSNSDDSLEGLQSALNYARREFGNFQGRYLREIKQLCGAMAYQSNLEKSPYKHIFYDSTAWDEAATSFVREFCSVLGLSADSPLYLAATAGAIALPTLLKMASIMKEKKTEWTSENELPEGNIGRDTSPSVLSFPFGLRLPGFKGAKYRAEPTDDATLLSRHRARISNRDQQG